MSEWEGQALPVPPGDPDFSSEVLDAEEFLRRVVYETKHLPAVKVVEEIPEQYRNQKQKRLLPMTAIEPEPDCKIENKPNDVWVVGMAAKFADKRQAMNRYRALNLDRVKIKFTENMFESVPDLITVSSLNSVALESCLLWFAELPELKLTKVQYFWLYCLLLRLDKPIHASMASSLRGIHRKLLHARSQLDSTNYDEIAYVNIIACIIDKIFSQSSIQGNLRK